MKERTVAALLTVRDNSLKGLYQRHRYRDFPKHIYVYCKSKSIAKRFLMDAEKEGFTFGDGAAPTSRETDELYAIKDNFTISYTMWMVHLSIGRRDMGNILWIDYEKYLEGEKNFFASERKRRLPSCILNTCE